MAGLPGPYKRGRPDWVINLEVEAAASAVDDLKNYILQFQQGQTWDAESLSELLDGWAEDMRKTKV